MKSTLRKSILFACIALILTMNCSGSKVGAKPVSQPIPSNLKSASVDPGVIIIENFEGWGTSLCWWANIVGNWPEKERNRIINYVFGKDYLDFNIARYNIGASPDPNTDADMRPGGAVPCYITAPGVYDWKKDKAQRFVLLAAKRFGANIFEAFANSPPWWMTWTGDAGGQAGSSFCGPNLRPENNGPYADFLTEVVKHFKDEWGINFRTIEPFNEPNSGWWCEHKNQEGCFFETGQQDQVIRLVGESLKKKRLNTVVAAPDTSSVREAVNNYNNGYSPEAKSFLGQINTHTYNQDGDEAMSDLAKNEGKRLWMSEYGLGPGDCQDMQGSIELAEHIISDLYNLRPSAWVHWQAVGFGGCGGNWGLVITPYEPGKESPYFARQFHTMRNFSRFIRPGSRVIQSGYNKAVAAYDPHRKTLSFVVFNERDYDYSMVFDLTKFAKTGDSVIAYRTSRNEDFVKLPPISVTDKKFVAANKARSITSYMINNVDDNLPESIRIVDDCVTSGTIRFTYTGNWQHCRSCGDELYAKSNSWGSVPEDYATIDFVGNSVILCGVIDPSHGIAAVSVDGGKETDVDFYSSQRDGNVHLFSKKWTFSRHHRIKIRITGRKNPASSNVHVVLDRVVVFNS